MTTAILGNNVGRYDELDDCLIDSIAIADLLMNSRGEQSPKHLAGLGF